MTRLIYIDNAFEPNNAVTIECDDVAAELAKKWTTLPENVGLFHERISFETNVTPSDAAGVERFRALTGTIYAVSYPGDATTVAYIVIALVFAVASYALAPGIPAGNSTAIARPPTSSNNDLSERTNKPRLNGRIPDIYGQVISVPDLIAATYSVFIDHEEYEYSYLCVGRGEFDVTDIKDDTTLVSSIEGSSVAVYGPNTSPNNAGPQVQVGPTIEDPLLSVVRTTAVNGQTLNAPNEDAFTNLLQILYPNQIVAPSGTGIDFTENFIVGDIVSVTGTCVKLVHGAYDPYLVVIDGAVTFEADGTINGDITFISHSVVPREDEEDSGVNSIVTLSMTTQIVGSESINLSGTYMVELNTNHTSMKLRDPELYNEAWLLLPGGATALTLGAISISGGGNLSMAGPYEVTAVSELTLTFLDAGLVQPNWAQLYNGGATMPNNPPGSTTALTLALNDAEPNWIGPFDVFLPRLDSFIVNLTAERGMFKDDGTQQLGTNVRIQFETTLLSANGSTIGAPFIETVTVVGSATTQSPRRLTYRPSFPIVGASGVRIRGRRTTERDLTFEGQVVDSVQWKDLYGTSTDTPAHFGDVTTAHSLTRATKGALSLKSRKLNMRVTRRIPVLSSSGPGLFEYSANVGTRDAASILSHIARDQKLGNRLDNELDHYQIRTTIDDVKTYFGKDVVSYFNYTFDNDNTSAEEMLQTVASAVFCNAYRQGSVMRLFFEKLTDESSLLFCHRNKLPKTEKRTVRFGPMKTNDGIEYTWFNPTDGASEVIYVPADRSAINPKKIDSVGVRNFYQASLLAKRIYNRMRYQRLNVEFKATHEAEMLIRNERVLVSDNTKPYAQDGEVKEKNGLVLRLSQPVTFTPSVEHSIFLQLKDGTVQSIVCTPGDTEYHVVLAEEPLQTLSLNPANFAITTYVIVPATQATPIAFLVDERTFDEQFTSNVKVINYDARYYANDQDYNYRLMIPMEDDATVLYDDATAPERAAGSYLCEDNGLIPTVNDPGYVLAEDDEL